MIDRLSPSQDAALRISARAANAFGRVWLIEDDAQTTERQRLAGVFTPRSDIVVQVHRVTLRTASVAATLTYKPGSARKIAATMGRAGIALGLLNDAGVRSGLVIAGTSYGSNRSFIPELRSRHLDVAVEVRHQSRWRSKSPVLGRDSYVRAEQLLAGAHWRRVKVVSAENRRTIDFVFSELGFLHGSERLRAFAFAPGLRPDADGDLRIGVTSLLEAKPEYLVQAMGWIRWIRSVTRRRSRHALEPLSNRSVNGHRNGSQLIQLTRPNISLAKRHDQESEAIDLHPIARNKTQAIKQRTVVELFAGAGGLGLGFLLSGGARSDYRLVCSAEVEPIYVQTLRQNHSYFASAFNNVASRVPQRVEGINLRSRTAAERLSAHLAGVDRLDVLMGGPPCQGFSSANRNNWSERNPNNQLVDVFLGYVRRLQPRYVLLENVQGILWTGRPGSRTELSVAEHAAVSLKKAGYLVFPKLLDAVWYGVPQHRARFFLLAIHSDEGYGQDDFGKWGPFPRPTHGPLARRPYITVDQAIRDLPPVDNGASREVLEYRTPSNAELAENPFLKIMRFGAARRVITDHVATRHAGYVIERYRRIPQGGNWQNIAGMMKNYSAVERTHSNIYRRLRWDEPAITIGHYRKSMLVHPEQHRGISLREAARLQSFPDWFRFAGNVNGEAGGLMHKQQQLANAVCPMMSRAIADFLTLL